jgi:phosphoribosylanthranilate isomerase
MTRFKICGFRDLSNALVAAESGADLLGFVFVEGVRRQLLPEQGAKIISDLHDSVSSECPGVVGLFANQSAQFVNEITRLCGLNYVQLCGDEPPEMWDMLDVPVIRQVKVREDLPRDESLDIAFRQVQQALGAGNSALLDKYQTGHLGGTGITFDWQLARDIARDHRVVLAGGLTPENVSEAIETVRPWGVDVSSGVETNGRKDPDKIRAFAAAVHSAG